MLNANVLLGTALDGGEMENVGIRVGSGLLIEPCDAAPVEARVWDDFIDAICCCSCAMVSCACSRSDSILTFS